MPVHTNAPNPSCTRASNKAGIAAINEPIEGMKFNRKATIPHKKG